jgi:hypothetical protein
MVNNFTSVLTGGEGMKVSCRCSLSYLSLALPLSLSLYCDLYLYLYCYLHLPHCKESRLSISTTSVRNRTTTIMSSVLLTTARLL